MTLPHDRDPETHMRVTLLMQGKLADGRDYWAYVEMPPSKAIAFKQAQVKGHFRMQDYGEVLEWGEGAEVPADVKARMEAEQRVNHGLDEALSSYDPKA